MKLQIKNEFGSPLILQGVKSIAVRFEYENGEILEKRNAKILDAAEGKFEIDLDEFEIQGLKVGEKQSFYALVHIGDDIYKVIFREGLNVYLSDQKRKKIA
jgi:hypothetical protein